MKYHYKRRILGAVNIVPKVVVWSCMITAVTVLILYINLYEQYEHLNVIAGFALLFDLAVLVLNIEIKLDEENPSIGIILCKEQNDFVIEYSLPKDNKQIFSNEYQLVDSTSKCNFLVYKFIILIFRILIF